MTDAFRFWFDNPQVYYGYAIRLSEQDSFSSFRRLEAELGEDGPVLEITYSLGVPAEPIPTVSEWGVVVLGLLLLTTGSLRLRRCYA